MEADSHTTVAEVKATESFASQTSRKPDFKEARHGKIYRKSSQSQVLYCRLTRARIVFLWIFAYLASMKSGPHRLSGIWGVAVNLFIQADTAGVLNRRLLAVVATMPRHSGYT